MSLGSQKISLFYENGNKYFEGYLTGCLFNGQGILFYKNGNKAYEGQFHNGKREGKGISFTKMVIRLTKETI